MARDMTEQELQAYYDKHLSHLGPWKNNETDPETGKSFNSDWDNAGYRTSTSGSSGYYPSYGSSNTVEEPVRSGGSRRDYYQEYLDALQAMREAEEARIRAQIEQAVGRLQNQKPILGQQFGDSAQQAYIQSMLSKRDLPQQLAAQGISGGASESANLAIDTAYGNAYNNLQRDYNNNLAALDADIANVRASGDISIAESANSYAQQMAQAALQQQQQLEQAAESYKASNSGSNGQQVKKLGVNDYKVNPEYADAYADVYSGATDEQQILNNFYGLTEKFGLVGAQELLQLAQERAKKANSPSSQLQQNVAGYFSSPKNAWSMFAPMNKQAGMMAQLSPY